MSVYQVGWLCSVEAYEALERYAGNDPEATHEHLLEVLELQEQLAT